MDKNFSISELDDTRTYNNIRKISTCQEGNYTTGSLLDYPYFKEHHTMMAIDWSKEQALDSDPKAIQYWKSRSSRKYNNVFNY